MPLFFADLAGRPRVTTIRTVIAAVLSVLIGATGAQAAAFEQISRGNGANGAALFSNRSIPVFASDTGRFGIFQQEALLNSYDRSRRAPTKLRNIVDNTTRTVGVPVPTADLRYANSELVWDVTNDEKTLLMSAANPTPSATTDRDTYRFFLRPVAGGPDVTIAYTDYSDEYTESGAISGDGSTVAVVGIYGVQVIDVATGASTTYPAEDALLTISDDGTVIVGTKGSDDEAFTIVDGVFTSLPAKAKVSPDGSTLLLWTGGTFGPTNSIEVRGVRTGTSTTFAAPAGGVGRPLWVSPDGNRIAFAPNPATPGANAMYLNVTTGTWAKFGRQFSASLDADSRISRSGRYAVIEYRRTPVLYRQYTVGQAALVDLTGADLPGTQEALSASSYLRVTPPLAPSFCENGDGVMKVAFGRPASWAPLPRKGEVTVTIDGVLKLHRVFREPTTTDIDIPFAPTARSVTTKVKVVDYLGRTLSTEQTIAVQCRYDEP